MKLTDDKLCVLYEKWLKLSPTASVTAALFELLARRAADLSYEEIEALRGCSVHCLDARQLELATGALDKIISRGGQIK